MGPAWAAEAAGAEVSPVVVVAPTPLPGTAVDADKLPGVVVTLDGEDFARTGSLAVTEALQQRTPGLSLSDTQGNAFTRDVDFRGFEASPLQGAPQGLAVYMDGVRLNEAFGDTVNLDLVPAVAIARADLFTSNPAFGLNALGGALNLQMKTGFGAAGGEASVQGGAFGQVYGSAEQAFAHGPWAVYAAADGGQEDGWRRHSPSKLARGYADIGWRAGPGELHLSLAGAANDLGVVGPTPADLLSADRRAVYTYPQGTRNTAGLAALKGSYALSNDWSVQGVAYVRTFNQHHVDGNDGDFEGCSRSAGDPLYGTLCVEDDDFPDAVKPAASAFQVLGPDGQPIGCPPLAPGETRPCNGVPYGSLDRTRTAATTWGVSAQATSRAPLLGHGNAFAVGASFDRSRIRFSANSTLGMILPSLEVASDPDIPGEGEIIHTAGAIAYSPVELRAHATDLGVYATDTVDLTRRLALTLSGRLNVSRLAMADMTGVSPDLDGRHRFSRFDPAAGLAWRIGPAVTAYGGYSEANRAPTALELACSDPLRPCLLENALVADPPLKPVVAHSWEAGLRGAPRLGAGVLSWRLGAFQTDNDDDVVAVASIIQGRGSYANVPKTRRRGVEASAHYAAGRWSAYANYSHVVATYRFSGALPSPNSPFADDAGDVQVNPGDRIGGVPAQRLKAGVDVTAAPWLTLGLDAVAIGKQRLIGDEANQDAPLKGYWTADLHADWRLTGRLALFGRVNNLFDRRYASYGAYFETDALENLRPSPLPDDPDPRSYTPGAPRAVVVGLRARW